MIGKIGSFARLGRRRTRFDEALTVVNKMTENFVAVYYVDLANNTFRAHKADTRLTTLFGTPMSYTEAMETYAAHAVLDEDREKFSYLSEPRNVMDYLIGAGFLNINYHDVLDGVRRNFRLTYKSVDSDCREAVLLVADNTDTVRLEKRRTRQLEEARKHADAASEAKSRFLFNVSHDIRTPMNAIIGFTNKALNNLDDPRILKDSLDKVSSANEYMLELVNNVLDMARIEAGKLELKEKPVYIRQSFLKFTEIMATAAAGRKIALNVECSEMNERSVMVDWIRVRQVLSNIVSNAIKYTTDEGRIDITVSERPESDDRTSYVFTVQDTGVGMSPEFLEHIFERFEREATQKTSGVQGTGLGMAIVRSLVELMHGKIRIESEQGKGTKVTLHFAFSNAAEGAAAVSHGVPTDEELTSIVGMRVLLVEDNSLNRELATDILTELGVNVDTATDGEEAVEAVGARRDDMYDLVLMDIQMPIMDGYTATARIRSLPEPVCAQVPIVAMTANAFDEDRERATEAGMDGHLSKPINMAELTEVLARFAGRKDNTQ